VPLTVNLNHAVWTVTVDPNDATRVTGVRCFDLLAQGQRTYQAAAVVLSAGTIESAKIALQSGLSDPNGKIGKGITDHMIRYRHFVVPPGHPNASTTDSAKLLLQNPAATVDQHAFDIIVELGAEFNQGRYIDPRTSPKTRTSATGTCCARSCSSTTRRSWRRTTSRPSATRPTRRTRSACT
jgi:hypothetical protein